MQLQIRRPDGKTTRSSEMQRLRRNLSAKSLAILVQERNVIQPTTTGVSSSDSPANSACGPGLPSPRKKRSNTLDSKHHHELRQKTQVEATSSSPAGRHHRSRSNSAIAKAINIVHFQSITNEPPCSQSLPSMNMIRLKNR